MIICDIVGGLGNQMFQYACGRAASLRSSQELKLSVDRFGSYTIHQGFELERVFNLAHTKATKADVDKVLSWRGAPLARRILGKLPPRLTNGSSFIREPHHHFWPGILEIRRNCYLQGYWQSEKYFSDFATMIRDEFQFAIPQESTDTRIFSEMRQTNSVAVHVRRGDYTRKENVALFAPVTSEYYNCALRVLQAAEGPLDIFLFSDDGAWAMELLKDWSAQITLVDHNKGSRSAMDMFLMSHCRHNIIANSTFSWWGAWLNSNPDKQVFAPAKWFTTRSGHSSSDLIPESWRTI